MTTLKDHAETLERNADKVVSAQTSYLECRKIEVSLRSIAADLRARDEAEKRMCNMATGRDTGDTQPAPAVGETPKTDKLWEELYGTKNLPSSSIAGETREHARQLERELNAALAAQERKE